MTIQMNMDRVAEYLAANGQSLADQPDLAAKIMVLNEQLAALPDLTTDVFTTMVGALLGSNVPVPRDIVDDV